MGKTSRRRAAASAAVLPPSSSEAGGSQRGVLQRPAEASAQQHWYQIDRWEQVVLMFLCVSVTMNFLGDYVPGLKVLMEREEIGCVQLSCTRTQLHIARCWSTR